MLAKASPASYFLESCRPVNGNRFCNTEAYNDVQTDEVLLLKHESKDVNKSATVAEPHAILCEKGLLGHTVSNLRTSRGP